MNKHERKKEKRRVIKFPLLTLLAREILYLLQHAPYSYGSCACSYTSKGSIIVWDDCNHKTYRKLVKVQKSYRFVKERYGPVKHFQKPLSDIY